MCRHLQNQILWGAKWATGVPSPMVLSDLSTEGIQSDTLWTGKAIAQINTQAPVE